jgi:putative hydrolase of the HAD superfamily
VVCTSEQIGAQKPDPYAFVEFAKRLEILPSACLFVGDSAEQDIAGARGAGMRALLINRYGNHAEGIASAVQAELSIDR